MSSPAEIAAGTAVEFFLLRWLPGFYIACGVASSLSLRNSGSWRFSVGWCCWERASRGGRALTLWIDGTTHRLDRVVEPDAAQRKNTTHLSNYRQVDGVWYPFVQRSSSGDPSDDVTMFVKKFEVRPTLTGRDFAAPPSIVRDARLLTNGIPPTIPFVLKGGLIIVNVSLNGEKPLPFVLDSEAMNILTPEAAKNLNVAVEGNFSGNGVGNNTVSVHLARMQKYTVGPAELSEQQFFVNPLGTFVTSNGRNEPVAGLIGYEVFRRFVVRINYYHRELTFSLPSAATQKMHGEKLPLAFDGRDCFVKAPIDGVPGPLHPSTSSYRVALRHRRFICL